MDGIMDVGGQCSGIGTFPLLIRGGLLTWIGNLDEPLYVGRNCTEPYTCFLIGLLDIFFYV